MASFEHATFDLMVDNVALALQCCIGVDASFLRVFRLSDKRFRFSVASNHVGHFVYSLRERSWPDFQILFSLFRGDVNAPIFHDPKGFTGPISFHSKGKNSEIVNGNLGSVSNQLKFGSFSPLIPMDPTLDCANTDSEASNKGDPLFLGSHKFLVF